jgi:hypothetical protein
MALPDYRANLTVQPAGIVQTGQGFGRAFLQSLSQVADRLDNVGDRKAREKKAADQAALQQYKDKIELDVEEMANKLQNQFEKDPAGFDKNFGEYATSTLANVPPEYRAETQNILRRSAIRRTQQIAEKAIAENEKNAEADYKLVHENKGNELKRLVTSGQTGAVYQSGLADFVRHQQEGVAAGRITSTAAALELEEVTAEHKSIALVNDALRGYRPGNPAAARADFERELQGIPNLRPEDLTQTMARYNREVEAREAEARVALADIGDQASALGKRLENGGKVSAGEYQPLAEQALAAGDPKKARELNIKAVFAGTSNAVAALPLSQIDQVVRAAKQQSDQASKNAGATANIGAAGGYLSKVSYRESQNNPNAKSRTSNATGKYQFTPDTLRGLGVNPDKPISEAEQDRLAAELTYENADVLTENLGREPTDWEVYAAHHFGAAGATSFLEADEGTGIDKVLSERAVKANQSEFRVKNPDGSLGRYKTVGELSLQFRSEFGDGQEWKATSVGGSREASDNANIAAEQFKILKDIQDGQRKEFEADPITFGTQKWKKEVGEMQPIAFAAPDFTDKLGKRAEQAALIGQLEHKEDVPLLTKSEAQQLTNDFNTLPPEKVADRIVELSTAFGPYWPKVFQNLHKAGLPEYVQVLGALDAPFQYPIRQAIIEYQRLGKDAINQKLDKETRKEISEATSQQYDEFGRTLPLAQQLMYQNAIEQAAMVETIRTGNPAAAVAGAVRMVTNNYSVQTTYRIPRLPNLDVRRVSDGLDTIRANIRQYPIIPPQSRENPGINRDEKFLSEQTINELRANGRWRNNEDETGVYLTYASGEPVLVKDSQTGEPRPLLVKFEEAAKQKSIPQNRFNRR